MKAQCHILTGLGTTAAAASEICSTLAGLLGDSQERDYKDLWM